MAVELGELSVHYSALQCEICILCFCISTCMLWKGQAKVFSSWAIKSRNAFHRPGPSSAVLACATWRT